jgi:hypothetical protein
MSAERTLPRTGFALYGVLLVAALVPIAVTTVTPLDDYLNHIARMYILVHYDDVPALHRFFEPRWALLPNLAMEMVVVPLGHVIPVLAAGRAFVALSVVALIAGVVLVNRALSGRWSAWPLAAFAIVYNDTFLFGFQSYVMSLGVALLLFALWVRLHERATALRVAVFTVGATLLYFGHLTGFGIYGILVAAYEVSRAWAARRERGLIVPRDVVAAAGQFVLPIVLFVLFSPTAGAAGKTTVEDLFDKWHYVRKLTLLFDVFRSYVLMLDQATFALAIVAVVAGLATRRLRFAPHGFLPCLGIAAAFALLPRLVFSSDFADDRLAVALAFVFVATTEVARLGPLGTRVLAGALAAVAIVRIAVVGVTWHGYDRAFAGYLKALDAMPEGQVLGAVIAWEGSPWNRRRPPLYHFLNLATITRHAFYPTIFAVASQQPLALKPPYREISERYKDFMSLRTGGIYGAEPLAAAPFGYDRLAPFDYVMIIREHLIKAPRPPFLVRVSGGEDFGLYRVEHR